MPTPVQKTPQEGSEAAKEPVSVAPTSTVSGQVNANPANANPANSGETVVVIPPSVPQGDTAVEGAPALSGTYSPVEVAPQPTPDRGVNSGMGSKNDNYDDHPDLGIAGLG